MIPIVRRVLVAGSSAKFWEAREKLLPELAYEAFPLLKRHCETSTRGSATAQKKAFAPLTLVETPAAREWLKKKRHDKVVGALATARDAPR